MKFWRKLLSFWRCWKTFSESAILNFEFIFFIPMKICHKLCVRMDGTQFLLSWWFTAKNEVENDTIAWVYIWRKNIFRQCPYLEIFTKFDCNFFVFTYVMYATRGRFLPLHPFLLFLLSNFWQVFVKVTEIQSLFSKDQIYVHFFYPNMLWILLTFTCQIILTFQDTCLPLFHPIPSPHFQKHFPPIR